ncbi:MAG: hypothetical protein OXU67_01585 [Chloroflexota bacterium]|nr:hypothetical protein [Chloroflexota bacterium]
MTATIQPVKRTPLYRTALALGATLTDHAGCQIAARFRSPDEEMHQAQAGVVLADASWLGKLETRGRHLAPTTWQIPGAVVWPLVAGDLLVTCEPRDTPAVLQALKERAASALESLPSSPLYVTDVTSVYAALLLAGPRSRAVLQRLTALGVSDAALPDLACARTGLAHVHATILRQDLGPVPAYWLLVGWEYGAYVWDAALHAGESFGIAPIGLEAVQQLRGAL